MDFGAARQQQIQSKLPNDQADPNKPAVVTDPNNPNPANPNQPPADDEDSLLLASLKKKGYNLDSLDQLKTIGAPPPPAPTAEEVEKQKTEKLQAREKRIAEIFVADGGTQDDYDRVQAILKQEDFTSLAKADIIAELKEEGFDDAEAEKIYKNRYFIKDADSQDLFSENEVKLGEKKLKGRADSAKAKAASKLVAAEKKAMAEEWVSDMKASWTPRVEAAFSELPTEISFNVLDSSKTEVPVNFTMDADDLKEIKEFASDPDKIATLMFNSDKSTNIKGLIELLTWKKIAQKLAAHAFTTGESVATGKVEAVFPRTPRFGQHNFGSGTKTFGANGKQAGTTKKAPGQALFGANKRN